MAAAEDEPVLNAFFWFFALGGWAFRMMMFFVLAGYFTRGSYHSKGPGRFLWERTLRLLVPAIVYSCLVLPFLAWLSESSDSAIATAYADEVEEFGEFYIDAAGNMDVPPPHTKTLGEWYKTYYTEPDYFGFHGPVWFVYTLYRCKDSAASAGPDAAAGGAAAVGKERQTAVAAAVDRSKVADPFPMRRVLMGGVYFILSLWVAQFFVRLVMYYAAGDTMTDYSHQTISYYLINVEPALIPQYIAGFTLGILAQKHNGLLRLPAELGIWCVCSSCLFYVLAWAVLWSFEDLRTAQYWGDRPGSAAQLLYVLVHGFVEMAFGAVWTAGWLVLFREMFNTKPKKFGAVVIGATYAVYLIHPIFITLYGRMLEHVVFPTFVVNSIFVAYLTAPSTWLLAALIKLIPGMNRIL
ncbi:hypothetical protein COO60DRAFT_1664076 [Scenedesmus sp. NREL 46B-D3]|nr:hypothetical protein COO60DRAFT_1664076 [Scenedesmus sp. NREL 46B-D3]